MSGPKTSKFPSTVYRVSVKAVIKNGDGKVFVVKEQHEGASPKPEYHRWELPGGGIDHGETVEEALKRELKEEVGVSGVKLKMKLLGHNIRYVELVPTYKLDIFYLVEVDNNFSPIVGEDVKEIAWKDPDEFRDSEHEDERLIYGFGSAG
jgi:mutator protein MutT